MERHGELQGHCVSYDVGTQRSEKTRQRKKSRQSQRLPTWTAEWKHAVLVTEMRRRCPGGDENLWAHRGRRNHPRTGGTFPSLSLEGNEVLFPSTSLPATDHKRHAGREVVFPVSSLAMTIKCRFTQAGHQARSFSLEGKQGKFCAHNKNL